MAKDKKLSWRLIVREEDEPSEVAWALLEEIVAEHHPELEPCRLGMAWALNWNANPDGQLKLGQAKICSELDRNLHELDALVLLNRASWVLFEEHQRRALVDHELTHIAPKLDKEGQQQRDEAGRLLWRARKHDLEEFSAVVRRYGVWKRDLRAFYEAMSVGAQRYLFEEPEE